MECQASCPGAVSYSKLKHSAVTPNYANDGQRQAVNHKPVTGHYRASLVAVDDHPGDVVGGRDGEDRSIVSCGEGDVLTS